jgi:hypothetical protein
VALTGDSILEIDGDGGRYRLGNVVAPEGADMGTVGYGLAGAAVDALWFPHLHEQSVCVLMAVEGVESCALSSLSSSSSLELLDLFSGMTGEVIDVITGDASDIALRKSIYATGGLMGVLNSSLIMPSGIAESGLLAEKGPLERGP